MDHSAHQGVSQILAFKSAHGTFPGDLACTAKKRGNRRFACRHAEAICRVYVHNSALPVPLRPNHEAPGISERNARNKRVSSALMWYLVSVCIKKAAQRVRRQSAVEFARIYSSTAVDAFYANTPIGMAAAAH